MKLYYTPGACSLAAHIILNEINVDFEIEKVNLDTHRTEKDQDFYKINPKGFVPALEINQGSILTENVAILTFLAQKDPHQKMTPSLGLDNIRLLEWLGYLNSQLHNAYLYFFHNELTDDQKLKGFEKINKYLVFIDNFLEHSDHIYLVNDSFGPADAYFFVLTNWSSYIKHDLTPYKHILALRKNIEQRQSVQVTMKKEGLI